MRIPVECSDTDLKDAYQAASTLASRPFRPYLPGRLLPLLVERFRDEAAQALGLELPPLPRRLPVRPAKLPELTTAELGTLSGAVGSLVSRFTPCMDDPALPRLLQELGDGLLAEKAERAVIAAEITANAKAS